jgi:hypothetical protein
VPPTRTSFLGRLVSDGPKDWEPQGGPYGHPSIACLAIFFSSADVAPDAAFTPIPSDVSRFVRESGFGLCAFIADETTSWVQHTCGRCEWCAPQPQYSGGLRAALLAIFGLVRRSWPGTHDGPAVTDGLLTDTMPGLQFGSGQRPRVFSPSSDVTLGGANRSKLHSPFWYELNEVGSAYASSDRLKVAGGDRLVL